MARPRNRFVSAPTQRMVSVEVAAEYCGFKTRTEFERECSVSPVNFGAYVRYDMLAIDKWLDSLTKSDAIDGMEIVDAAGENRAY